MNPETTKSHNDDSKSVAAGVSSAAIVLGAGAAGAAGIYAKRQKTRYEESLSKARADFEQRLAKEKADHELSLAALDDQWKSKYSEIENLYQATVERYGLIFDSIEEFRANMAADVFHRLYFEEFLPLGGFQPNYGIAVDENPAVLFYLGPLKALFQLTGLIEQYAAYQWRPRSIAAMYRPRNIFANFAKPFVNRCFAGTTLYASKLDWSDLRKKALTGSGSIPSIARRWNLSLQGAMPTVTPDAVVPGACTLKEWKQSIAPDIKNWGVWFERCLMQVERGLPVTAFAGSNSWLYKSPSFMTFVAAVVASANVTEDTIKTNGSFFEAISKSKLEDLVLCMPKQVRDIAEIIGFRLSPNTFDYATHWFEEKDAVHGFSWITEDAPASFDGVLSALMDYMTREYGIDWSGTIMLNPKKK